MEERSIFYSLQKRHFLTSVFIRAV